MSLTGAAVVTEVKVESAGDEVVGSADDVKLGEILGGGRLGFVRGALVLRLGRSSLYVALFLGHSNIETYQTEQRTNSKRELEKN